MLVLLIIFMVAAPIATVSVPLDLPVSTARPTAPPPAPIVVSIQRDNSWSVGERKTSKAELGPAVDALSKGDHGVRIFVRADKSVAYEHLIETMDALRLRGYLKIALIGLDSGSRP
jgi:biopolymer transport protein ExbD